MKKIMLTDTTLRDGQQSLIATRMKFDDIEPIIEKMDNVGFHSLEVWGGATFDSSLRFLSEDPWERLRKFRKLAKNTKLQMLFRGQNILGYKAYPDDIVEMFVRKTIENGIDILRIFDALNDVRNIETSVKAAKKEKGHAQLCISYTLSDVHTMDYYMNLAKSLENIGADSICIKDMAGLLTPQATYDLVKNLKDTVKVPLQLHSHYTSGLASMCYLKAMEAGIDILDTAFSPFALGTAQPATEVMAKVISSSGYESDIKEDNLSEITEHFAPIREKAIESGLLSTKVLGVDINTLKYQVPGGMLSNLISQLKAQNAEHKYAEVLKEIPKVRADLGYPPLVTPTSQIVGTQSVINVMTGERYKMVTNETKDLVRGMYGKTPVPISEEIKNKIIGEEKPITGRAADILEPGLKKAEEQMKEYKEQDEDVLSYALFPQVAEDYFKFRQAEKYKIESSLLGEKDQTHPV